MVVTRKSSHSPMPPTSRTSSTQAIPRATRAKTQLKSPKDPEMDDVPLKDDDIPEIMLNSIKDEPLDAIPPSVSLLSRHCQKFLSNTIARTIMHLTFHPQKKSM